MSDWLPKSDFESRCIAFECNRSNLPFCSFYKIQSAKSLCYNGWHRFAWPSICLIILITANFTCLGTFGKMISLYIAKAKTSNTQSSLSFFAMYLFKKSRVKHSHFPFFLMFCSTTTSSTFIN